MTTSRRLAALPLLLIGLAALCAALALIPWVVQAQSQEVTPTASATGANPPAKPTNLQASAEHDSVTLTWTASTDQTVTHYAILRRHPDTDASQVFHVIESNAGPETSYTDSSVSASSTYIYRVKSVSPTGVSQWSGYVKIDTPAAPTPTPTPAPDPMPTPEPEPESAHADLAATNLTTTLADGGGVALTWTAPAEDADSVTGYEVLRAVGEGELATLEADTGSTTTTYTDATAIEAGETYAYEVKAIRDEDRSQASGQAQVQLPHDPVDLAPSNLTAEKVDGGINLSWTAPAEDADSVTGYEVLRAAGEDELTTLAADTGSTATTYSDATATDSEETYAYQVKAVRGQARSQGSNKVVEAPEPPATPENLAPSNLTFVIQEDGVELTWDAPVADADSVTGYRVLRRLPNQGENEWVVWKWNTGSTETAYKDGYAQTLGEYYMYRVRALRGDDYSKMSNRVDVRRPQAAPETTAWAPSNLEALVYAEVTLGEEGVTTQVKLTWDAPAEGVEWVRGYEVQRATCDGGFTTLVSDTGSTATAYADADVEAGESYTYRVRARRPQGLSLTSNTWTLLTPGGTGESDCAVPVGAPEPEPVEGEDVTYAFSQHDTEVLVKNTGQTASSVSFALNNSFAERAQQFTTGANTDGYTLGSIGIMFHNISNTSTAGSQLTVTLNADNNGNPGDALCTLSDPATFTSSGVQTFSAPGTCPALAASTAYFAVIDRVLVVATDTITLSGTASSNEDTGGAAGWTVVHRLHYFTSSSWESTTSLPHLIEVNGHAVVSQAFNFTLSAAGNQHPTGLWSDGATMWVADFEDSKIYAYNMATKVRVEEREFDTLASSSSQEDDNSNPKGIWSDGATMWVSDENATRVFAYDMTTKARVKAKEFRVPARVVFTQLGSHLETDSRFQDIWSDGNGIMWLVSDAQNSAYAYRIDTGKPVPSENLLVGQPYQQVALARIHRRSGE